ncbi:MAG: response regulator [Desulfobacterales bacterium]|nr:response regulator [Desulfobacterales bacterium]MBF0396927.1 response regulator [Desulfobacterales bacterium]
MNDNKIAEVQKALILIVDDVPKNLQVLASILKKEGYRISAATNGMQALKLAAEMLPNLILLDINMPEMDGFEVCTKLKGSNTTKDVPVIFLTARTETEDIVKAFQTGAVDYVTKPINTSELLARVKTHLELANYRLYLEDIVKQRTFELSESNLQLSKTNIACTRFVPAEFLKFLDKKNIIDVNLGDNVQKKMTILFSDIRSFTEISENMSPQENFDFLNRYLTKIGPAIRDNNGFIDKYIGDAIMALFPRNAEDAIRAAISMKKRLSAFNDEIKQMNLKPVDIGIGINTGLLMLGIIGFAERTDGTVISDAVNLASRLEGLTKLYGITTIISDQTLFCIEDPTKYHFRFIEKVKVKGKTEPVSVFEIFDTDPDEIIELKQKTMADFEYGTRFYYSGKFDEAIDFFNKVLHINGQDKVAKRYLERCKYFQKHGNMSDWDGIEIIDVK